MSSKTQAKRTPAVTMRSRESNASSSKSILSITYCPSLSFSALCTPSMMCMQPCAEFSSAHRTKSSVGRIPAKFFWAMLYRVRMYESVGKGAIFLVRTSSKKSKRVVEPLECFTFIRVPSSWVDRRRKGWCKSPIKMMIHLKYLADVSSTEVKGSSAGSLSGTFPIAILVSGKSSKRAACTKCSKKYGSAHIKESLCTEASPLQVTVTLPLSWSLSRTAFAHSQDGTCRCQCMRSVVGYFLVISSSQEAKSWMSPCRILLTRASFAGDKSFVATVTTCACASFVKAAARPGRRKATKNILSGGHRP
mmetsp:Transcript_24498/g.53286  ORF Transcript_24498/g.53286 Transcript_24498/m.53286 type:complete len:306 (-) Transcript_24498:123-1040(-)